MKILQINKFYYLRGGSERHVFGLSEILEEKGHKVMPFSMQNPKNKKSEFEKYFIKSRDLHKFNIINVIKYFYNFDAVKRLKKLIKDEKPDIAHLHNITGQLTPAIIKLLKKHNIPMVMTLHDYRLICPNSQLYSKGEVCYRCQGGKYYNCLLRKCAHNSYKKSFLAMLESYLNNKILNYYKYIDIFIAPSRYMKEVSVQFGIPENKIKVIYNFIPKDLKNNLQIENNKISNYLLYFGRLSREKGIGVLIDAFRKVKGYNLKIVGSGPEYENLQGKIKKLKLNNIELLGPKYGQDLEKLVKNVKAVIIPSLWQENMPYSLLESLDAGKIVIASRIGGMKEIINDGQNGFLFTPGDSQELANKINNLKSTDCKALKNNIKKTVLKFNIDKYIENLTEIYKSAINIT